jgi:hypothetical protein
MNKQAQPIDKSSNVNSNSVFPFASMFVASFGGCLYGLSTGIIAGLNVPIINNFFINESSSLKSTYQGILTSCILFGGFIGTHKQEDNIQTHIL